MHRDMESDRFRLEEIDLGFLKEREPKGGKEQQLF